MPSAFEPQTDESQSCLATRIERPRKIARVLRKAYFDVILSALALHCLVVASNGVSAQDSKSQNLAATLADAGVVFPGDEAFALPQPVLGPDQTPAQRLRTLEELATKVGWERFARDNLNAPVNTSIRELKDAQGKRLGYSVHQSYIAYGGSDSLEADALTETTFGKPGSNSPNSSTFRRLTENELEELGLLPTDSEQYAYLELPLLRKVLIRGVVRLELIQQPAGYALYWLLDPRYSRPAQDRTASAPTKSVPGAEERQPLTNSWSQLTTNDLGEQIQSPPTAYQGLGGYLTITPTGQQADQWLVESRMILHEPDAWFGGSKYLRSKLLLSMQETAKSFRRKLKL